MEFEASAGRFYWKWQKLRWRKDDFFTILGAAWINTGAWFGADVVSVVIIVVFEPVNGERIWNTAKKDRWEACDSNQSFVIPRGRMGAAIERS